MKFSRRNFLLATASVLTIQAATPAQAGGVSTNNNRVTINVPPGGFMNLAKSANFNFPSPLSPSILESNGYPTSTPPTTSANMPLVANYYGEYVWKWSGRGSMQFSLPVIIYSGAGFVFNSGRVGGKGSTTANTGIFDQTNPSVLFKFGALVASVRGGNGSPVTITTTQSLNFGAGLNTGSQISFAVGVSSNLVNGPNPDGSWTVTNVSGTQFTLNNSSGVVSPTVTGRGGPGLQTEAILQAANISISYQNSGTFSGFTNLVFCKATNETAISNGQIYDAVLVSQLQYLMNSSSRGTPGWLRFMDVSGVQGNYECDFSQRVTASSQCWASLNFPAAYQAGAITWGGSDAYSCANPSGSPASGPPIDCEIIQGTPSATNTGGSPTLTVTGRTGFGTWPIIDGRNPFIFRLSSAPSVGSVMQWTFTATWLNGGVPYVKNYTTRRGDASVASLNANLQTALNADGVLSAGKIVFTNSAQLVAIPRTPLAGALTISYSSGPAVCIIIQLDVGAISTKPGTFIFNALLGGFVYVNAGLVQSIPFEAIVDLCNRVGANCWYTWPIYTNGQYITDVTNFFANNVTGLTSGLKFGTEMGNEIWNFASQLWSRGQAYGFALNLPNGSNIAAYSWQGLRTIQYAALSRAAWNAAGRVPSDHYILTMSATFDVDLSTNFGNFDAYCLQGSQLSTSNSVYANFGGLGATSSPSYTAAGGQPVDSSTAIGCAPYWASPWFAYGANVPGAGGITGTVAQNAPMLQAALDYGNGLTAQAFSELVNQFNGTTTRSSGTSGGLVLNRDYTAIFTKEEAQAAQYDARRVAAGKAKLGIIHYEGGPNWGMGADLNNGVNSVNSTDITALANQITALSWNVSAYTVSRTNNATEMATMIITMAQAWKYDVSYKNLIKTYYYQALKNTSGANREARPAQYGYAASQWCFFPGSYQAGNQYQSYDAIHEFNA